MSFKTLNVVKFIIVVGAIVIGMHFVVQRNGENTFEGKRKLENKEKTIEDGENHNQKQKQETESLVLIGETTESFSSTVRLLAPVEPPKGNTNGNNPDPSKPDPSKNSPSKPDSTNPNPSKTDPSKPDPSKPDPSKPDPSNPNPTNSNPTNSNPTNSNPTNSNPSKPDPPKPTSTPPSKHPNLIKNPYFQGISIPTGQETHVLDWRKDKEEAKTLSPWQFYQVTFANLPTDWPTTKGITHVCHLLTTERPQSHQESNISQTVKLTFGKYYHIQFAWQTIDLSQIGYFKIGDIQILQLAYFSTSQTKAGPFWASLIYFHDDSSGYKAGEDIIFGFELERENVPFKDHHNGIYVGGLRMEEINEEEVVEIQKKHPTNGNKYELVRNKNFEEKVKGKFRFWSGKFSVENMPVGYDEEKFNEQKNVAVAVGALGAVGAAVPAAVSAAAAVPGAAQKPGDKTGASSVTSLFGTSTGGNKPREPADKPASSTDKPGPSSADKPVSSYTSLKPPKPPGTGKPKPPKKPTEDGKPKVKNVAYLDSIQDANLRQPIKGFVQGNTYRLKLTVVTTADNKDASAKLLIDNIVRLPRITGKQGTPGIKEVVFTFIAMKEKMPIELVSTGLGKTGKRGLGFRVSIKEAFDGALFHEYISTKNDAKPAVLVLGEGKPNKKGAWKVNAGNAGNAGSGTVATGTGTGTGPSSAVVPAAAVGATTTLKKL